MDLPVRESRRACQVTFDEQPSPEKLREQILRGQVVAGDFTVLTAPAPAHDDTLIEVAGNDRELLVAIALFDSQLHLLSRDGTEMADDVEILFGPKDDGIGYIQFYFGSQMLRGVDPNDPHRDPVALDKVQVSHFLPYPEGHTSRVHQDLGIRLLRYEWRDEPLTACRITGQRCRWLFAWFDTSEVFRHGPTCGFNVCRNRPYLNEFSSWNYCGGNGSLDGTSLGRLVRFDAVAPQWADAQAVLEGAMLNLTGAWSIDGDDWRLELIDPLGQARPLDVQHAGQAWEASAELGEPLDGRYRLRAQAAEGGVQPPDLWIDVPSRQRTSDFRMGVVYDPPMSIIANHYTPERLSADMALWAQLGVRRIHWIEYGDCPSFWSYSNHQWVGNADATFQACGDFLTAAARAAHAHGLEIVGDLKTFDLAYNCFFVEPDGKSTVEEIERKHVVAIPEIAAHRAWTMQVNPAWHRKPAFPITRLRLYSRTPLPEINASDIRLWTSTDNRDFSRYEGPLTLRQGTMDRPHMRWTPAGSEPIEGTERNWYVELSGLDLQQPFLSVQLGNTDVQFHHQAFMAAEAFDGQDRAAPLTLATNGSRQDGYFFWKGWQGWNNQNEANLLDRPFNGANLGLVFEEARDMPALLEPAYEGARRIWLGRAQHILDAGADGVGIRSYCHHNGPENYLKYAFAQPVRETFASLYGRQPRADWEDYQRIRQIRGDFYTQFIREAKVLVDDHGKKLMVELESGAELPVALDTRMQLPMDWRRWIEEGLVDEIRLKWFTAQSTFVHEQVMPLARRHDIPVQIISRCLHTGIDLRASEMGARLMGDAAAAGFDGYSLYEQQNLMDLNPLGRPMLKGPVRPFFAAAREALREGAYASLESVSAGRA